MRLLTYVVAPPVPRRRRKGHRQILFWRVPNNQPVDLIDEVLDFKLPLSCKSILSNVQLVLMHIGKGVSTQDIKEHRCLPPLLHWLIN